MTHGLLRSLHVSGLVAVLGIGIILGAGVALASTPNITGVSGTPAKGTRIKIMGSAFGFHADNDPDDPDKLCWAWQDFEGGTVNGDGFVADAGAAGSIQWLPMSTGNRAGSLYWAKRTNTLSGNDNMGGLKRPGQGKIPYRNPIFVSFWFKIPSSASSGKFARFWETTTANFWTSTGGSNTQVRASDDKSIHWGSASSFGDEVWERFDMLLDFTNNTQTAWIVGKNNNDPQWTVHFSVHMSNFQANIGAGKDTGGTPLTNYYGYDDVFIDFTQARVELCNAPTWGNRTSCEIQIPQTWSATAIDVRINQGAFKAGTTAYLYVVDENGNVNASGYPVVIGASTEARPAPPAPSSLQVR